MPVAAPVLVLAPLLASPAEPEQACDVNEMWERMVEAKEWSGRLHEVTTLLVESRDRRRVGFWAFPDIAWGWLDLSGTVFGDKVSIVDTRTRSIRYMNGPGGEWDCKVRTDPLDDDIPFSRAQPVYLLETRFCIPELKGCGMERIDGMRMRFVEVEKDPLRLKYYLPRGSYLSAIVVRWQGDYEETHYLRKYQAFDGIQQPTQERIVNAWSKVRYSLRYEINPEYDPAILTKDPDLAEGPDASRPKEAHRTDKPKREATELELKV